MAKAKTKTSTSTAAYKHPEATTPLRPEVGTQAQFKKKKPPAEYRFDSSLSPALDWDSQNPARELGAWLLASIEEASRLPAPHAFPEPREFKNGRGEVVATVRTLGDAVARLKQIQKPFLDWAGKAERLSFEVPTLPLFVHERLSTRAILETLKAHRRDKQADMFDLFGDPQHPVADQVLRAYEFPDRWQNRMILGDSLVVMNSLLKYEGLGGQVQMIYIDPPYGVKFGSNFQPFVRKRDVKHNDDEDMTREPEMVKAYRDTWELGLHSYLTYLRDRILLARHLLHPSGSVFVQISDENLHHVRELMDEVFGPEHFCSVISIKKTSGMGATLLATSQDFLLWYAKDKERTKFRRLFTDKYAAAEDDSHHVQDDDGRLYMPDNLTGQNNNVASCIFEYEFEGERFRLPPGRQWKTTRPGLDRLVAAGRVVRTGRSIRYKRYVDDFPASPVTDTWHDIGGSVQSRSDPKIYVVQTGTNVIARCILMTTDPGDLVFDPTCGSGTTAFVAEQWGRRWITCDTSRVPLALARQRLLTATFPYYVLNDDSRGPVAGFAYKRKQNNKGDETGGIVPHITLKSIATDQPPEEEVLVDRPERLDERDVVRVTGPFVVEATIPTPVDWDSDGKDDTGAAATQEHGTYVERMIEVLRRSPVLHLGGNNRVNLRNVRPPAKTLCLSAEAIADDFSHKGVQPTQESLADEARRKPVAIVFGPESGSVSNKLVENAAREAHGKSYSHLYVIGFAIDAKARETVNLCEVVYGIPATYVQATPDLMMGDLLKNMRSSQIFSVCGLPEIKVRRADPAELKKLGVDAKDKGKWHQVELLGLDTFDPGTMQVDHRPGGDVPCWMLDGDYNGLCFRASQVFFPRTGAWEDLKRSLKAEYAETVWDHLAGTVSAPFQVGDNRQVAVKVIDDRGNELLVVKAVEEAAK